MKFGDLIKYLRESKGFTQQQLADKAEISRSVLSQYENNLVDPTAYVVKKLAIILEVSADYLLGLTDDGIHFSDGQRAAPAPQSTSEENDLLFYFRELSPYLKGVALDTVRAMAGGNVGESKKEG